MGFGAQLTKEKVVIVNHIYELIFGFGQVKLKEEGRSFEDRDITDHSRRRWLRLLTVHLSSCCSVNPVVKELL